AARAGKPVPKSPDAAGSPATSGLPRRPPPRVARRPLSPRPRRNDARSGHVWAYPAETGSAAQACPAGHRCPRSVAGSLPRRLIGCANYRQTGPRGPSRLGLVTSNAPGVGLLTDQLRLEQPEQLAGYMTASDPHTITKPLQE